MDRRCRNVVALRAALVAVIALAVTVPIIKVSSNEASAGIRATSRQTSTWTKSTRPDGSVRYSRSGRRFAGTRAASAPSTTAATDPTDAPASDSQAAPPTLAPPTTTGPDGSGGGAVGANATPPTTPAPTTTAPAPTTRAPATTAPPAPAAATSGAWSLGQRPFVPSSSWNTPIPSGASYTNLGFPASTGNNYWVDWEAYSVGVYMSRPSDPLVAVHHPSGWGRPAGTINLHLPAGVTGAAGDDGSIVIVDGNTVYNMWQFVRNGSTASCDAVGFTDVVNGTGWAQKSPPLGSGITSVGASHLAGLLVQSETDAGEILHALELSVEETFVKPGQVGEAIHNDGQYPGGKLMEGQRLGIPRGSSMPSGLSPLGQKVFRAFQTYGAYAVDASTGSTTLKAQSNAYDAATINALRKDMQKMGPLLQAVN